MFGCLFDERWGGGVSMREWPVFFSCFSAGVPMSMLSSWSLSSARNEYHKGREEERREKMNRTAWFSPWPVESGCFASCFASG